MSQSSTYTFDFIVVGGGAAGCVMAAKLAEGGRFSVALLETGRRDINPWIHIPATFILALQSQDATAVTSEPDPSLGMKPFVVPQGQVIGGGSSVNGMLYMRGQPQDYEDCFWCSSCSSPDSFTVLVPRCQALRSARRIAYSLPLSSVFFAFGNLRAAFLFLSAGFCRSDFHGFMSIQIFGKSTASNQQAEINKKNPR